jgi:hypothetical protein
MRNTTPNRSSQFIAMAVSGDNVGQSAVANDLSSYLANTVRVESPVVEKRIEDVTLNANDSKLSFRKTDRIETWAELVDIAFVWLAHAENAGNHATLLSGTAEVVDSLTGIGAPYEVVLSVQPPQLQDDEDDDELPSTPLISFEIDPNQAPDSFSVYGLVDGARVGSYNVSLSQTEGHWNPKIAIVAESDLIGGALLRACIDHEGIEIHFETEHLYSYGTLAHRAGRPIPFRGYEWRSFTGFNTTQEKPSNKASEMRRLVGTTTDNSLFGWVVADYPKGWLVCDDGANETADFVNLTDDTLALIAVKAAKKGGTSTSTEALQLVQAQAAKNISFMEDLLLLHATLAKRQTGLVVFKDGQRQADAHGFLAALRDLKPASIHRRAIIVQPQLCQSEVQKAHNAMDRNSRNNNVLGMMRIDEMLRALDSRCAQLGFQMTVIGAV